MSKIAVGTKKNMGKTWFPELSDKRWLLVTITIKIINILGKSTKVHLYYCMKNCERSADKLRSNILNIITHYQVILAIWQIIELYMY